MKKKTALTEASLNDIRNKLKMLYEYTYFNKEELTEDEGEETTEIPNGDEIDTETEEVGDNDGSTSNMGDGEMVEPNTNDGLTTSSEETSEEEFDGEEYDMINIDDLTNSQKNTESMVGDVSVKLNDLIQIVQQFSDNVDDLQNQNKELYRELEKRIPTKTEKLNMRVLKSYPYDTSLTGYWSEVEKNSNYRAYTEDGKADSEEDIEYIITLDDVKDDRNSFRY